MAKNIPLSTIRVKISYCVETTAGTRPTQGYTIIPGIYSTPDFNVAPSTADVTSFDNKEYTSKISLLKEIPDNIEFGVRLGQGFVTQWEALVAAYKAGIEATAGAKETWFCINIPGLDKSIYFTGKPIALGLPAMEANSSIDSTAYVAPTSEPVFEDDPTDQKDDDED